jgi:DNA-binding PadR family transcriptional regulator
MGAVGAVNEKSGAALRSPVSWALLGLVIQRPSYGYELVQRFERTYGHVLELSSPSQIYTALDALERRELIEKLPPGEAPEISRQPKPHYRPTPLGIESHAEWLIEQAHDERRRSHLFVLQLAVLGPRGALAILERYEQACLRDASEAASAAAGKPEDRKAGTSATSAAPRTGEGGQVGELAARLAREEQRLSVQARLAWIGYARRELGALPRAGAPQGTGSTDGRDGEPTGVKQRQANRR